MKKLLILLAAIQLATFAHAKDIILTVKPVNVPLPVNKEIIVKFPYAVLQTELLSPEHAEKFSQFLTPEGALHLTATQPFDKTRLVAEMVNGKVVLLDLKAGIGALNHEVINLVDPKSLKKVKPKAEVAAKPKTNPNKPKFLHNGGVMTKTSPAVQKQAIGYNTMTQFGFRHFVGPSRLIGDEIKAKKVRVSSKGLNHFVRLYGNRISLKPLAQWKIGKQFLTVLLVNNQSTYAIPFDPRALRGRLEFSASLHPVIQPAGSMQDQTLWAVITGVPFNKAIRR